MELDDARLTVLEWENFILRIQEFYAYGFKVGVPYGKILNVINGFEKVFVLFFDGQTFFCKARVAGWQISTPITISFTSLLAYWDLAPTIGCTNQNKFWYRAIP